MEDFELLRRGEIILKKALKHRGRAETTVSARVATIPPPPLRHLCNIDVCEKWRRLNNRAGSPHVPFQRRVQPMLLLRRMKSLQNL